MKTRETTVKSTTAFPAEHELKKGLGVAYPTYKGILELTGDSFAGVKGLCP
jgi:hypothetical protein